MRWYRVSVSSFSSVSLSVSPPPPPPPALSITCHFLMRREHRSCIYRSHFPATPPSALFSASLSTCLRVYTITEVSLWCRDLVAKKNRSVQRVRGVPMHALEELSPWMPDRNINVHHTEQGSRGGQAGVGWTPRSSAFRFFSCCAFHCRGRAGKLQPCHCVACRR